MLFSKVDYAEMTSLDRVHYGGAKLAFKNYEFRDKMGLKDFKPETSKCWNKLGRSKEINKAIEAMDGKGVLKKVPILFGLDSKTRNTILRQIEASRSKNKKKAEKEEERKSLKNANNNK